MSCGPLRKQTIPIGPIDMFMDKKKTIKKLLFCMQNGRNEMVCYLFEKFIQIDFERQDFFLFMHTHGPVSLSHTHTVQMRYLYGN